MKKSTQCTIHLFLSVFCLLLLFGFFFVFFWYSQKEMCARKHTQKDELKSPLMYNIIKFTFNHMHVVRSKRSCEVYTLR